jgi:hypothetical protein
MTFGDATQRRRASISLSIVWMIDATMAERTDVGEVTALTSSGVRG